VPVEKAGFLGRIKSQCTGATSTQEDRWTATVGVQGVNIHFKLDPGADVTAIPFRDYTKRLVKWKLSEPGRKLNGPDGCRLVTKGKFMAKMDYQGRSIQEEVYVVEGLQRALLGLRACEDLEMVKRINRVEAPKPTAVKPKKEFPKLFKGLGKIETPHHIKLKEGSKPFAVFTPRRVPLPLMKELKKELDEMVLMGAIEPVDQPTEWCAPLVIAPKPNGRLRICVDLSELNRNVEREVHPMPSVEHTLGQLTGARFYSKIDTNSGFWQI
jgi:hypothetical protein